MAEGRTAAEREAARREREAARAARAATQQAAYEEPPPPTDGQDADADADGGGAPDDGFAADPEPRAARTEPRVARAEPRPDRPIKSFPSPPDPDFYLPEDELETPSGTKRVNRLGNRPRPARPRPARRRRQVAPRSRQPARARRRPWLVRVTSLIALVIAAALAWFLIQLFQPFGTSAHGHVRVTIPNDASASDVAKVLHDDGVISSQLFFELRATLAGDRSKLRAGHYRLQQGMSYGAVLRKLTTVPPPVPTTKLTITDGHSRAQVAALLRGQKINGNYVASTRRSKLLDPQRYGAPKHTPDLEGFLFPDTFRLRKPVKLSALVDAQLKDFKRRFDKLDFAATKRMHLTRYQVLIVASLIEGEAATQSDRNKVASVIYNRLHDNMALQLDATTRYATGNYTKPLTAAQLHSDSPYNTRVRAGLPPTPINSPGLSALQAATHPAHTKYLYFFARHCTQKTVFFTNYTAFLNADNADQATRCK